MSQPAMLSAAEADVETRNLLQGSTVPLGNVLLRIESGKSIAAESRPAVGAEYGVLKVSAVTWGKFRPEENKAFFSGHVPDSTITLRAGDLLISRANTTELVGAVAIVEHDYPCLALSDKTLRLIPRPDRGDARYLMYALRRKSVREYFEGRATGTSGSMRNISQGTILGARIPLPPLPEQKRIAAILDKADAIRRKRQQAIQLTESLLRSAFLEMFGDPVTNPKGWEVKKLGAAIAETQYGTAAKANSERIGLPVLRMNNITYSGGWDLRSLKWCEIQERDLDKYTTRRDDLLFNRTNSPELVGKTAVWDSDDAYAIAGYLVRVRFNDLAAPHYVSALLNSAFGKRLLFAKAKASNNMSNFSASELCRLEVPLPPRIEQNYFAALARRTNQSLPTRVTALQHAEDLGTTLTQRAFSGGL